MRTTVKEKTSTWNKSCKEIVKSELELCKMVEAAVEDEKLEQKERGMIRDLLAGLSDEMQRNLGEAQNRSYEVERKLDRVLLEKTEAFDKELGRPQLIMTNLWKMMQSRDTKNLNLDKDFEEIMS